MSNTRSPDFLPLIYHSYAILSITFFGGGGTFCYNANVRTRRKFSRQFGEWVREQRLRAGESQVERSGRLGISPAYLSQIEHGVVPEKAILERLAAALDEDAEEWLQAAGEASAPHPEPADQPGIRETGRTYTPVPSDTSLPVAGMLRAGSMVDAQEDPGETFPCLQEHAAQADYVVRVEGWSMFPELKPGDYVAVRKTTTAQVGDIVVARQGDQTLIKRLAGRRGRQLRLTSDNPEHEPLEGQDIQIIGVVVWQHRPAGALRAGRP